MGLAASTLILLWIQHELSFDRHHSRADTIYRVCQGDWYVTSAPLSAALQEDIPEIVRSSHYRPIGRKLLKVNDKPFVADRFCLADSSYFDIFDYTFLKGDPVGALQDPPAMVLTRSAATNYFGDEEPIGKTVQVENMFNFVVTAVIEDPPVTSSHQFDLLVRFEFLHNLWHEDLERWGSNSHRTWVRLHPDANVMEVNKKITNLVLQKTRNYLNDPSYEASPHYLQNLKKIHLYSPNGTPEKMKYVQLFSGIAILILLIACINFINLTTARGAKRAKEVGIRKVMGANRKQLFRQFLFECFLTTVIAMGIALLLVELALPSFNRLVGTTLTLDLAANPMLLPGLLAVCLFTAGISGIYPSLVLSSFRPVRILSGTLGTSGKSAALFRKILVVSQFAIAVVLIIAVTVIRQQLNFLKNRDLGFDTKNVICLESSHALLKQVAAGAAELEQNPDILETCVCGNLPGRWGESSTSGFTWPGKDENEKITFDVIYADYGYTNAFNLKLAEGRYYSEDREVDKEDAVVINQAAARVMGIADNPLGKTLSYRDGSATIIGVLKDYHARSFHYKIRPLVIALHLWGNDNLVFRLNPDRIPEALAFLDTFWKKYVPDFPFTYEFLDEAIDHAYVAENRLATTIQYFTTIAIVISYLGLFGLISYIAAQRTREIGIRKVLGASFTRIIHLITREFTLLILIANVIAWPIGWFFMKRWLETFSYRISLEWWIYAVAGVAALLLALSAAGYHAIRATRTNPVNALKYE